MSLTRDEVLQILCDSYKYEWQVQGFGMLRTYLGGPGEPRLQIWDQRLAAWGNNAIHDHPWSFTSTIYAGIIFNQRYEILFGDNGHITEIVPGTRGGKLSERPVNPCFIKPYPLEAYGQGESYSQTHREMHLTRYLPGTVTLITRSEREPQDIARVAWYGKPEDQPPFVNPYPAFGDVISDVIQRSILSWWK